MNTNLTKDTLRDAIAKLTPKDGKIGNCPCCDSPADWNEKEGVTGAQYYIECVNDLGFTGCIRQYQTYARRSEAIAAWKPAHKHRLNYRAGGTAGGGARMSATDIRQLPVTRDKSR